MVNFIQAANDKIKINEDASYLLNNALHVNAVFTASGGVTANQPVLRVNLPNVGANAVIKCYKTGSDYTPIAATVTNTTSSVNGLHNITIQLDVGTAATQGDDTAAEQEYHIEGWIALP